MKNPVHPCYLEDFIKVQWMYVDYEMEHCMDSQFAFEKDESHAGSKHGVVGQAPKIAFPSLVHFIYLLIALVHLFILRIHATEYCSLPLVRR